MSLLRIQNPQSQGGADSQGPAMADSKDRMAEVYNGKLGSPEFQRDTKSRIHWVCEQVSGDRVLDVGCSQGITSILLARENFNVTGIDIDAACISDANSMVSAEPNHVIKNINFIADDFLSHDFGRARFDTVVLSEVLEHLTNPDRVIEAAASVLNDHGRLVVTVPFGINDYHDHKKTYYMSSPYRKLNRLFEVDRFMVLGRWIGYVCTKRSVAVDPDENHFIGLDSVRLVEEGFFAIERNLRDELAASAARIAAANKGRMEAAGQASELKRKIGENEVELQLAQALANQIKGQLAALEEKVASAEKLRETDRAEAARREGDFRDKLMQGEIRRVRDEGELTTLRAGNHDATARLEKARTLHQELTGQLEEARERARAAEGEKTRLSAELTELKEALAGEVARHQAQAEKLEASSRADSAALEEALARLQTSQRELAGLRESHEAVQARGRELLLQKEKLDADLAELGIRLEAVTEERLREKGESEREGVELRGKVEILEAGVREATEKIKAQDSYSFQLRGRLNQTEKNYQAALAELQEAKAKVEQGLAEGVELRGKVEILEAGVREATEKIEAQDSYAVQLRGRLNQTEKNYQVTLAELQEAKDKVEQGLAEAAEASSRTEKAQAQLSEQLAAFKASAVAAEGRLAILQDHLKGLKAGLAESEEARGVLARGKEALEKGLAEEKERHKTADEAARRDLAEKTVALETLESTVKALKGEMEAKGKSAAELQVRVAQTGEKLKELEKSLLDSTQKAGALEKKLAQASKERDASLEASKRLTEDLRTVEEVLIEERESAKAEKARLEEELSGRLKLLEEARVGAEARGKEFENLTARLAGAETESKRAAGEAKKLADQLAQRAEAIKVLGAEKDALEKALESARDKLRESLDQGDREREEAQAAISGQRGRIEEIEGRLTEAREETSRLTSQLEEGARALAEAGKRSGDLEAERARVSADLQRVSEERDAALARAVSADVETGELRAELERRQGLWSEERRNLAEAVDRSGEELAQAEARHTEVLAGKDEEIRRGQAALASFEERVAHLGVELDGSRLLAAELESSLASHRARLEHAESDLREKAALVERLNELAVIGRETEKRLEDAKELAGLLRGEKEALSGEVAALREQKAQADISLVRAQAAADLLGRRIADRETELAVSLSRNEGLSTEVARIKEEAVRERSAHALAVEAQLSEVKATQTKVEAFVSNLDGIRAAYQKDIETLLGKIKALDGRLNEKEEALSGQTARTEALTRQLGEEKSSREALEARLGEANRSFSAQSEEMNALRAQKTALEERLDQVVRRAAEAEREASARLAQLEKEASARLAQSEKESSERLAQSEKESSERLAAAGRQNAELASGLEKTSGELIQALKRVEEAAAAREALSVEFSARIGELTFERDHALGVVKEVTLQREALKEELSARVKALSEEREGMDALIGELTGKSSLLAAALSDSEGRIDALSVRFGESQARLSGLEEELTDAELRLMEANEALAAAREEHAELLEEERSRLRQVTGEMERQGAESAGVIVELRKRAEDREAQLEQVNDELSQLRTLHEEVRSTGEMLNARIRDQENLIEKMKLQALRNKKELGDAARQISQLNQGVLAAEHKALKTKDTLSYQLGFKLIHGFKSFDKFVALPGELLKLRSEAKKRRQLKERHQERLATVQFKPREGLPAQGVSTGAEPPRIPAGQAEALDLKALKVACIMDEFTFTSFRPECNFMQLSPIHWRSEIEAVKPDLLFIESAWRGKDSLWGNKVAHRAREIVEIAQWCSKQGIPSAFWNKEDPVHFETFITTAKLFDHVFTTDIDCIGRYKAALGHDRVYLLPFAAQPKLCNPIETYERKDAFSFAGAYYVRYPERTADLCTFLNVLPEYRPVEIYDRNFGKNDPNFQFPDEYAPFIVGTLPFNKIDKAYKGYRYAINLNSIKNSQSMFARRVFELLASNTFTVSNFSRGLRLMFGDLVVATDSGQEVLERVGRISRDPLKMKKMRLLALRKTMSEHTYEDRVAYVVSKIQGRPVGVRMPRVVVTAYVKTQDQFQSVLAAYLRQKYANKLLYAVCPVSADIENTSGDPAVVLEKSSALKGKTVGDLFDGNDCVAGMVHNDYYGENYLTDLALGSRYCDAGAFVKSAHYVWSEGGEVGLAYEGRQYRWVQSAAARSSLFKVPMIEKTEFNSWVTGLHTLEVDVGGTGRRALAIDEFNYCKNGENEEFRADGLSTVSDDQGIDPGLSLADLTARAEAVAPQTRIDDEAPVWGGDELHAIFTKGKQADGVRLTVAGNTMLVESELPDGKHVYITSPVDFVPQRLGFDKEARFHLDVTPGLNIHMVLFFLDADKKRVGEAAVKPANKNATAEIPPGTAYLRFGMRVYSAGSARVNTLVLGHRNFQSPAVVAKADHLILTNFYPSYAALYRNAFVHSRVKAYKAEGVGTDVFCLRQGEPLAFDEFSNIDVISGSQEDMHNLLQDGGYKSVLVHFLDPAMWEVLKLHIDKVKVFVWVHGSEVQPWHRRDYNFKSDAERDGAKVASDRRQAFWRDILTPMHPNMKLIFVSRYFADEVLGDLGINLDRDRYEIIHNPIDTDLFTYEEKPVEQRRNILSIRPYAFAKYANDLSVKAILELSTKPWFRELKIRMIGDGVLFDQILEPLSSFENVIIERRFLQQSEIAAMHKEYGVFLTPTRMDAQGVSRDEAMSSGLVPITNNVAAIPEFVDEKCGVLVPPEDYHEMAEAIGWLYENPDEFKRLSKAAAQRVRGQSSAHITIRSELALIRGG